MMMTLLFGNQRLRLAALAAFGLGASLSLGTGALRAEGLKSAEVSRIFNDVKLLPEDRPVRPAVVTDVITGKAAVQTGSASRTELTFSDKTLTRLGANSLFSFVNGTRDMTLGSGTMLLQVPKGAGGAQIHTAAVTAAITGTTLMVEFNPKSYSKIIVLEGTVRVFLTGHVGESMLVHAGEMVIIPPTAKQLPDAVHVDLSALFATSGLINDFGPLASKNLIGQQIDQQKHDLAGGQLQHANLYIVGRGTEVQAGNVSFVGQTQNRVTAQQTGSQPLILARALEASATPVPTPEPTPIPTPEPTPTPVPTPTPTPLPTPTPTPLPTPTPTPVPTPTPTPSPTPTPTPAPTPTPGPTPDAKTGPLSTIAGNDPVAGTIYDIDVTTSIVTDPFITTNSIQGAGRIYRGGTPASPATSASPDGLPSNYLLGATAGPSPYDTAIVFDNQFGAIGSVAAFRFTNLALLGTPAGISTAGGPTNLALIATGGITDSAPGHATSANNVFDLTGLDQMLFATQAGPITFNTGVAFQNSGSTAPVLSLYARGGALDLEAATSFNLPGSQVNLYSDGAITDNAVITAAGNVNIVGGTGLSLAGNITTAGDLTLATVNGDIGVSGNSSVQFAGNSGGFVANAGGGSCTLNTTLGTGGNGPLSINVTATNGIAINVNLQTAAASADGTKPGTGIRLSVTNGDLDLSNALGFQTLAGRIAFRAPNGALTLAGNSVQSAGNTTMSAGGALSIANANLATAADPAQLTPSDIILAGGTSLTVANTFVNTLGGFTLSTANGNIVVDGNCNLLFAGSNGGLTANAHGGSLALQPNTDGYGGSYPLFVTGTADNGIAINGTLFSAAASADGTRTGTGISLTANGGDIATNSSIQSLAGDVSITAVTGTINLAGNVQSAGSLLLSAGGAMSLNTTLGSVSPATLSSAATLTLANLTFTTSGAPTPTAVSDINLSAGASVSLQNVFLNTTGGLTLQTTAGNILVDGNCNLLFNGGNGGLTAFAHGGSLALQPNTDGYGGNYPLFVTGTADTGIAINGTLLSAAASSDGTRAGSGIHLTATGGNFTANAAIQSLAGDVVIAAPDGTISLGGLVNSAGNLALTSSGLLNITSQLTSSGPAGVASTAASLTLANLNFTTNGIATPTGISDISLSAATDLTLANVFVNTTGGLTLTTGAGNILVDGNCNLLFAGSNGGLTAFAHGGSLALQPNTDGYGGNYPLFVTGTADKGIIVNGTLLSAAASSDGTRAGSGIHLTATGGNFTANAAIQSLAGDVVIAAPAGTISLGGNVSSAGQLGLTSSGPLSISSQLTSVGGATLASTADALTISNVTFVTNGALSDISLSAATNISLNNVFVSTTGAVSLSAGTGNILVDGNCNFQFVGSNGGLTVLAPNGALTLQPNTDGYGGAYPLFLDATAKSVTLNGTLYTAAASGDGTQAGTGIKITATSGDFNASVGMQAGAGDIVLAAPAGAMTLAGNLVSGGSLSLSAQGSIVLTSSPIQSAGPATVTSAAGALMVQNLQFITNAGSSDVNLTGATDLTLNNVFLSSTGGVALTAGSGNLFADGNCNFQFVGGNGGLTVNAPNGTVTLQQNTDGYGGTYPLFVHGTALNGIQLNSTLYSAAANSAGTVAGTGIQLSTTNGDFNASAGIQSQAGDIVLTTQNGAMNLAGNVVSAGSLLLTAHGDITLTASPIQSAGPSTVSSAVGALLLQNVQFVTSSGVSDLTLTANTNLTANNVFFSSTGNIALTANTGNLLVDGNCNFQFVGGNGGLTVNAPNGTVTLQQNTDGYGGTYPLFVHGTALNGIQLNSTLYSAAQSVDGTQTGTGIQLSTTNGDFNASAGIQSQAGDIVLTTQNGAMNLAGNVVSAGSLLLTAHGDITLTASPIQSAGPATVSSAVGALLLQNLQFITNGGVSDLTLAANTNLTAHNVFFSSIGNIALTANTGNLLVDGNCNFQFTGGNGGLTANAPQGTLSLQQNTDGYGGAYPLFVRGTALNGIQVNSTLYSAAQSVDGTQIGTGIQLTTTNGSFAASAGIQSQAGDILLSSETGSMALTGNVISAGRLTLSAAGTMTLTSNPIQSTESMTLTSSGGALTLANLNLRTIGAPVAGVTSDISLNAATGLPLANTFVATTGSLSLTTTAGDISLDGNTNLQFTGDQGGLTLAAHGGNLTFALNTIGYGGNYPLNVTASADNAVAINSSLITVPASTDPLLGGGSIGVTAGTTLTLANVSLLAQGGAFTSAVQSTTGHGGAISLQAGGAVSLTNVPVNASGGHNNGTTAGGDAGSINISSTGTSAAATTIQIMGSSLLALTGDSNTNFLGTGGTINLTSNDATAPSPTQTPAPAPAILVDSSTIAASYDGSVSSSAASRQGGVISVTSKRTGGPGITVQNSSQLLALIDASGQNTPGGVHLQTSGADIVVSGTSVLRASGANSTVTLNTGTTGGTITVSGNSRLSTVSPDGTFAAGSTVALTTRNTLPTQTSAINLTDATLAADLLKVEALGTAGHLTIGGSSVLTGNNQLLLYAGDSTTHVGGIIEFVANTTLTSNVAGVLAASTVQIDGASTVVTVNSPAPLLVYGNVLNYAAANGGNGQAGYGGFAGTGAPTAAAGTFFTAPIPNAFHGSSNAALKIAGGPRVTALAPGPRLPDAVRGTTAVRVKPLPARGNFHPAASHPQPVAPIRPSLAAASR